MTSLVQQPTDIQVALGKIRQHVEAFKETRSIASEDAVVEANLAVARIVLPIAEAHKPEWAEPVDIDDISVYLPEAAILYNGRNHASYGAEARIEQAVTLDYTTMTIDASEAPTAYIYIDSDAKWDAEKIRTLASELATFADHVEKHLK